MRGLYAIVDVQSLEARGIETLEFARAIIDARPAIVQLRAKTARPRDTLSLLRQLVTPCRQAGVRVFANDRADLALSAGSDGVHVGQDDLPLSDVRRIAPGLAVGVSTHTLAELDRALAERPDYVAFGPVFATQSKQNPDAVVGLEGLLRARERARAAGIPLVAIGGIDEARASKVGELADLGAVIAALLPRDAETLESVTERARRLHALLGGGA